MPICTACGAELPSDARFCPSCGSPVPEAGAEGGEMLKLVSVLFADVVGSTSRSERMHPEDTRALMADYFQAMGDEIRGEGGTVEKFVGDAIMAVFGVPAAHEDDAVRAVRAARRMLARLERWNRGRDPRERIEIRVGVDTGEVLAAGSPGQDLLVTGDTVNVAARLQQTADPGTILIGERTARMVRSFFELRPLEPLELKGKSAPVPAWVVEREREAAEPRGVPGLASPMIGRDGELEVLRSIFARAQHERAPHLVTILGDAGVGKSRLVREFVAPLEVATKVTVGRCLPYGEGVTLWPLGEILKSEAVVLENDAPDDAVAKIGALVREAIPAVLAPDPERTAAALASTLGLRPAGDPLAGLDPREAYRALLAAWRALLAGLASSVPLVVVVEDLHWADQTMLDVLEDLAEHAEGPVLFLCTARPDLLRTRPDWGGGKRNYSSLPLDPLTAEESALLVSALLEVEELPPAVRARILERSEGNPFFLEEIVRHLIDEGLLVPEDGRWRAREEIAGVEIPDNVQSVILARIDLLSPAEKRALQRAAVVGRAFWAGAVARLASPEGLDEILRTLCRRELIVERLTSSLAGEVEYAFKHVLIRDVAYESLPRKERAAAHAAVAAWIEEESGERASELAELLAHHYDVAFSLAREDALRERARAHYVVAAHSAVRRFALQQAERFGRRAVELSLPGRDRADALESLGDVYYFTFQGDGAWRAYTEAIAELGDERDALGRLAAKATIVPTRWGDTIHEPPSREELGRLIEAGLEAVGNGDSRERSLLLSTRSFAELGGDGEVTESCELTAREALEIAERLDDPDLMSCALDAVGALLIRDGRYGDLHRAARRRVELVPRLTDVKEIGDCYAMAAWGAFHTGHYEQAVEHANACVERTRDLDPGSHLHGLAWRVCGRFMAGDWEGAVSDQAELERLQSEDTRELPALYARRAYSISALCRELRGEQSVAGGYVEVVRRLLEQPRRPGFRGFAGYAARALAHQGRTEEARALVSFAGRNAFSGLALEALCEIAAAAEDWDGAREILPLARDEAAACELVALPCFADRLEGRLAAAEDQPERAAALLRRSAEGFAALGAPWEEAWSRLLLGEALLASGDAVAAAAELAPALAAFERLGSVREVERSKRLLAELPARS